MNSRIFIDCVKCREVSGGNACGPAGGVVNTSIKFTKDGVTKWLTNSEVSGIPNFFLTENDIFDILMEQNFDDENIDKLVKASYIEEFEGIKLGDYDEIEEILKDCDSVAAKLVKLLIVVTRCSADELEKYIEAGTGKYVDEISIP